MSIQTVTILYQYINNSGKPTTVSKVVPAVVVNDALVPDFRQISPGVITDFSGVNPVPSSANYA